MSLDGKGDEAEESLSKGKPGASGRGKSPGATQGKQGMGALPWVALILLLAGGGGAIYWFVVLGN